METNNLTPIQTLITSASLRIRMLKESEFTPQAELAQLELLLAIALSIISSPADPPSKLIPNLNLKG